MSFFNQENIWGILSLVSGIISLIIVFQTFLIVTGALVINAIAFLSLGIFGIICFFIQKKREVTKISVAGLILGILSLILPILLFVYVLFAFANLEGSILG